MTEEQTITQTDQTMSATIGKLTEALSKAQSEMEGATKDSNNPFYNSTYADLASVWDACRRPLSKHGLAVVQTMGGGGDVTVITTLCHTSGEWIKGSLTMRPVKSDPQGIGSCITYARRYSLAAIAGVCPEDDDGNSASGLGKDRKPAKTTEKPSSKPREPRKQEQEWITACQANADLAAKFKEAQLTAKEGGELWAETKDGQELSKREQFEIMVTEIRDAKKESN